jgi:hypothetical protein
MVPLIKVPGTLRGNPDRLVPLELALASCTDSRIFVRHMIPDFVSFMEEWIRGPVS